MDIKICRSVKIRITNCLGTSVVKVYACHLAATHTQTTRRVLADFIFRFCFMFVLNVCFLCLWFVKSFFKVVPTEN